jgi:pectate lyase
MRFAAIFTGLVAIAQASPLVKRASTSDAASVGYATQNGGTTGGKGGSTVTVTTAAALQAAASGDSAKIIIVSGTITGKTKITVGSNKSIIGKSSSASTFDITLIQFLYEY